MSYKAAVITVSDSGFAGERADESGPLIRDMLVQGGYEVVLYRILPDERQELAACLGSLCDRHEADLVLTTGGTGFSPRDYTPEASLDIAERLVPGIPEAMRASSLQKTSRAMLSRSVAVIRKQTLIVNLPGSPRAAKENLEAILPALEHGLAILSGSARNCARPLDPA
ncbi:MAG: MogA/MoaB family molybdenum cofactor biosynthesis protein [Treponema sp.]|jgi:molybdenum cofactor synthesis domain-containing protein|nr:MogA/MoaB family molybdenum cofactor biosynthesis protein [Treponema sp.]